jgi:transposase
MDILTMPAPTPREEELLKQLARVREQLQRALQENKLLRQKLDALARRVFGKSSEELDAAQLLLLFQAEGESPKSPASAEAGTEEAESANARQLRVARSRRGPRIPEHLPVVEEVLDPESVKACPQAWRCIGEEVSEQIDYEPARFFRRRLIRRKYVRRNENYSAPIIAPLPESLQERCLAAPGLLAQVIVAKFADHLPLYRQEQIYRLRHGVELPRQTLARWLELAADWLKPIYEIIRTGVMAGGYVQVDETPIEYLCPGNGQTRLGYLWTCHRPGLGVFYNWRTSRAASCLGRIIPADFRGTVQSDGYAAYRTFAAARAGAVTLAGCWAHVRRKFHEAREQAPRTAGWLLRQLQHLYRIEARLRERRAGAALRSAERTHQSRPIVERVHRALLILKAGKRHLPQSLLGKAISYALEQWPTLGVFLEDGRVEIDNNLVENAIRPTAVGKKNWLFIGEADAGQRGAILYTLVENCRRLGLDPYTYLRDVLTRLPRMTNWQVKDITPIAWAKAQQQQSMQLQAAS